MNYELLRAVKGNYELGIIKSGEEVKGGISEWRREKSYSINSQIRTKW